MKITYDFIPQGAKVEERGDFLVYQDAFSEKKWQKDKVLILDTGNSLQPGCIDHHQPGSAYNNSCTASIVTLEAAQFIGHLKGLDEITIVTHYAPDLDAIGAVFLSLVYLKTGSFKKEYLLLADYIFEVDSGKLSINPEEPISIASIWMAIANKESNLPPFQRNNEATVREGIGFLDSVIETLEHNANPFDGQLLKNIKGFDNEKDTIYQDIEFYKEDVRERSICSIITLPNPEEGGLDELDVIITKEPKSLLWKYWVRGDKINSVLGDGFIATCAHWKNRSIISTDPNFPYNLKGLGLMIDRLEIDKSLLAGESLDELINGPKDNDKKGPRPGFHRYDPWYDGRGGHNYTIIDSPRTGTKLSNEELNNAFFATQAWREYGRLLDRPAEISLDHLLTLDTPVSEEIDLASILDMIAAFNLKDLDTDSYKNVLIEIRKVLLSSPIDLINIRQKEQFYVDIALKISDWINLLNGAKYNFIKKKLIKDVDSCLNQIAKYTILITSKDLAIDEVCFLFSECEEVLRKENFLSECLLLQNQHPTAFEPKNINALEKSLISNGIDSEEILKIIKFLCIPIESQKQIDDLPIYGFNNLKNYIDDLLICHSFIADSESHKAIINDYISKDFDSFFKDSTQLCIEQDFEISISQFNVLRDSLLQKLFGEAFTDISNSRNNLLGTIKGSSAKLLRKYSINEVINLPFFELKLYINQLLKSIEVSSPEEQETFRKSVFLEGLYLISEFAALENLYNRLNKFKELQNVVTQDSFPNFNNFTKDFNKLIYTLFRALNIYPNSTDIQDFENEIKFAREKLNTLRVYPASQDILHSENLRESIFDFVQGLLNEVQLNVSEIDEQIDKGVQQYLLLTSKGGILDQIEELPFFYRTLLQDIFHSFKRYYRERIFFFRNRLSEVIEYNSNESEINSNIKFVEFYNDMINESIKFDWQELKDFVDKQPDKELSGRFYQKYFNWKLLNIRNNKENLSNLNSEIRFAEGKSKNDFRKLVENLPSTKEKVSYNEFIKELAFDWKLENAITHLPIKLIHQSYDYVLDTYTNRFDIERVKNSLADFSTIFPWYIRFFTNKNMIQGLFLGLCTLLILVGVFDTTIYTIGNESFRPEASQTVIDFLGKDIFMVIAACVNMFWATLLSMAFILPVLIGSWLVLKKIIPIKLSGGLMGTKFKFMELVTTIEDKKYKLLYLSFILPLMLVVMQMASPSTISMINNIEGIRLISTLTIIVGLTLLSVYLNVKEQNQHRSSKWIINKTQHMFWLHLLQALILTVFVIDLLLRFELSFDLFPTKNELLVLGISKYIELNYEYIDFRIMPIFSIMVSFLTLFFSFFIDRVMKRG